MLLDDVKAEIHRVCVRDWEKELAPLAERLRHTDDALVFDALFPLAAHSQLRGPAAPAAFLLVRVNPKCPIQCRDAVQEMLFGWDVSIQEVPFYLARQFGVANVLAILDEMGPVFNDQNQTVLLRTIRYWLNVYENIVRTNHP